MRRTLALIIVPAALALAGCGGDKTKPADIPSGGPSDTQAQTAPSKPVPAALAKPGQSKGGDIKDLRHKPAVKVPGGKPPTKLVSRDIVVGKGKAAKAGDTVSVQYVGVLFDGAKQFDASWDHGQPFQFKLGAGNVIPGWDKGVVGMKVGGRRELTIPPDQAYGEAGQPPTIPPNATLVFVIDLKKIK